MDGTEKLPLTCAHLGTSCCGAWRIIKEKAYDEVIAVIYQESAEFVEPERPVNTLRLGRNQLSSLAAYRYRGIAI
jgi:hypothetical protein